MNENKKLTESLVLFLGLTGLAWAQEPQERRSTLSEFRPTVSEKEMVQSIKESNDSYQLELADSMGNKQVFTVPKNVEVHDTTNKRIALSDVKPGASVTLTLDQGRITQITLHL